MTRDEILLEIQRRIAEERGYTDLFAYGTAPDFGRLNGIFHADEGPTLVPRWPWDWDAAGELVKEMEADPLLYAYALEHDPKWVAHKGHPFDFSFYGKSGDLDRFGRDFTAESAIARCWCAWKGIDLSDLTQVAP